jgi:hypothetical protein
MLVGKEMGTVDVPRSRCSLTLLTAFKKKLGFEKAYRTFAFTKVTLLRAAFQTAHTMPVVVGFFFVVK